jgi:hypothetical protein
VEALPNLRFCSFYHRDKSDLNLLGRLSVFLPPGHEEGWESEFVLTLRKNSVGRLVMEG